MTINSEKFSFFILIFYFLNIPNNSAQSLEKKIENLINVRNSALEDSIGAIFWDIYRKPPEIAKKYSDLILNKAKEIDKNAYLIVKAFSLYYDNMNYLEKLDSIYFEAKENDFVGIMAWTLVSKSNYYKNAEKYDSAMVATLEAQNIYKEMPGIDGYVTCRQIIGDLYFTA